MCQIRLLVSVTSGHEAAEAIAGGADIIDAKDPSRGALGAVGPDAWAGIRRVCAHPIQTSAALGDLGDQMVRCDPPSLQRPESLDGDRHRHDRTYQDRQHHPAARFDEFEHLSSNPRLVSRGSGLVLPHSHTGIRDLPPVPGNVAIQDLTP